ncbi:MAG TPA: inositol monophosphatase family protein [Pirellulaceae bacterium]|nr:inositol monophosphatase family protein [Pirellulaceae bacterium]HMO91469.1 inositol monophosphatase family protein [Pirellulaceae bacterium]HMP69454.1 inositol monophosphatase family protein [Pirellulaceae bacterium]
MSESSLYLQVALEAAKIGGNALLEHFERPGNSTKAQTYNLVTEADIESERRIFEFIRREFPGHDFLGEESHESNNSSPTTSNFSNSDRPTWVIDPLDGTANFVHGIPQFAVSIAMVEHGKPRIGVIYNPVSGDLFHASDESEAMHNGRTMVVNDARRLDKCVVGVGFHYDRDATLKPTLSAIEQIFGEGIHGIRRMGAASLDLCNVACGRFGAYFEYRLAPWDFAAGWIIVERAGGKITQCHGEAVQLQFSSVIASNGFVHDQMVAITSSHLPGLKTVEH